MSSQSGITVPKDILDAFTAALQTPTTRCLVLTIPSTTAYALHAVLPSGTKPHPTAPTNAPQYISDIAALLPALPSSNTCAAFIIRNDTNQWSLISYIPDSAPVRQKMLHASSKSSLLKSLAPHHEISETLFFTSPGDLTPTGFEAHLRHREAPAPMTKSEEALRDVKASEQREAQERLEVMFGKTSITPSSSTTTTSSDNQPSTAQSRKPSTLTPTVFGAPAPLRQRSTDSQTSSPSVTSPTGGLARGGIGAMGAILGGASGLGAGADKGSLKWGHGVSDALASLTEPDSEGRIVVLSIDPKSETVILHPTHTSTQCPPESLAGRLPGKEPSYAFYAWPRQPSASQTPSEGLGSEEPKRQGSLAVPVDPAGVALPVTPTDGDVPGTGSPSGDVPVPDANTVSATPASGTSGATAAPPPKIAFIYACPSASPVRNRMLFSTCVRGLVRAAEEKCGVKITKKIETSDISELTKAHLEAELSSSDAPSLAPSRNAGFSSGAAANNGSGVDMSSGNGDAWNAFGPRVGGRPKPAGRR